MRIFIALLFAMATASYIELPGLFKQKQTKELWVFIILLTVAGLFSLANLLGVHFYVLTDTLINFFGRLTS